MRRSIAAALGVGALLATGAVPATASATPVPGTPGQVLAFAGYSSTDQQTGLMTVDTATGAQRTVTEGFALQPTWSPDGSQLAWISFAMVTDDHGRLQLANADGSGARELVGDGDTRSLAWAPDGTLAYLHRGPWWPTDCGAADRLTRHDLVLRSPDGTTRTLTDTAPTARDLQFSPDGGTVAWFESGADVCAWGATRLVLADVATGLVRTVGGDALGDASMSFSPDGGTVVLGTGDVLGGGDPGAGGDLVLVDVATATAHRVPTPGVNEQFPAFAPDGSGIAVARFAAGRQSLALLDRGGSVLRELGPGPDEIDALAWAPSGAGLAVAGATLTSDCAAPDDCDFTTADPAVWWQPVTGATATVLTEDGILPDADLVFAPWFPEPPVVERRSRAVRSPGS